MSEQAKKFAQAATNLVGIPFRPGGRSPVLGVDCIGLVCIALAGVGREVATLPNYAMRNLCIERFCVLATSLGLERANGAQRIGDVLVLNPSCAQFHLAIVANSGSAVHAHAGLRCVTASPLPLPWPLIASWRLVDTGDMPWPHSF